MSELPPDNQEKIQEDLRAEQLRALEWQSAAGPVGHGSIFLGPHIDGGCQAIFPPGTTARSPEYSESEFSAEGWRHAIWTHDNFISHGGIRYAKPDALITLEFRDIIALLTLEQAEAEDWLRGRVIDYWSAFTNLKHAAFENGDAEAALEHQTKVDNLLLDATLAFGEEWVRDVVAPPQVDEEVVYGPLPSAKTVIIE